MISQWEILHSTKHINEELATPLVCRVWRASLRRWWSIWDLSDKKEPVMEEQGIKATMRPLLTPVRMSIPKEQKVTRIVGDEEEPGRLVERTMLWLPWESVWQFLKKLQIELSHDPVIPLWDVSKRIEIRIRISRQCLHCHGHCGITLDSRRWKWPTCPSTDEWIECSVYIR